jgi:hypothetical protein
MFAEIERGMLEETDYVNEGRNIDFYREQLKLHDDVRIPVVHWDLSTDRILTMSFIAGEPISDFLADTRPLQEVCNRIGVRLVELFHLQIHRLRTLHADPHPGNYLIDASGTIGLVDFGCVKKFSAGFIEIMRAFEERVWLRGEEERLRMARLIWGPEILKKPRLALEQLKTAVNFYEMLFPGLSGNGRVVNFGDAKILKAMFGIFNDNLRHKTVNPEFAFYARAEMGLYNLLHLLRAKIDTSAVLEKFE